MNSLELYMWPYIGSQLVSVLILWTAVKAPRTARVLLAFLFGIACYVNFGTAIKSPAVYLDYASMAVPLYARFINGWFKYHTGPVVMAIAAGQGLIAAGMLLSGGWVRMSCIGAILFLMAIAPLGVGAAFPFSVTVSVAAFIIMKKDSPDLFAKAAHKHG
jgi:hypothetical protein